MDCMAASNPTFRALYKPSGNVTNDGNLEIPSFEPYEINISTRYFYHQHFMVVESHFSFYTGYRPLCSLGAWGIWYYVNFLHNKIVLCDEKSLLTSLH
jgi:hypothetical protein